VVSIVWSLIVAAAVSFALGWFLPRKMGSLFLDLPNNRSLHGGPIPRLGGIAIVAGVGSGAAVIAYAAARGQLDVSVPVGVRPGLVGISLCLLGAVSFLDDRMGVSTFLRLLVHLVSAMLIVSGLGMFQASLFLFGVAFLSWMINLYNFMDGMDGFAGGMTVFGFGTLSIVAVLHGELFLAVASAIIVCSCAGFLVHNFPPARLFMGDLGSTLLGAIAGLMLLLFHRVGALPIWLGILVFSPFVVDATATLVRRVLRRERFWEAHRKHYYQRLVQRGWGHRKTVLAEYLLMALTASSAVIANGLPLRWQWAIISVWILIYAVLMYAIDRTEPKENEAAPV